MFFRYSVFLIILFNSSISRGQDAASSYDRMQYPTGLMNSNFGVSIGYINYDFSARQLEEGYTVGSISIPHIAARINLFGHRFNEHLAANIHYLRPVDWVSYNNVNADGKKHTVWMNVVGLTAVTQFPITKKISWYGEVGMSVITRRGFKINNNWVVRNANYISGFFETGARYHLNHKWDLDAGISFTPGQKKNKQPATSFISLGFKYTMRSIPVQKVEEKKKAGFLFPHNTIQVGYTTNALGYSVNNFAYKKSPVSFFWGGVAEVKSGVTLQYTRNIFHTRKIFSFDWGVGVSFWSSRQAGDQFFTLSALPVLRFTLIHTRPADYFFYYSVAGPAYISKTIIDGIATGKHFTFQDLLGIGAYIGKKRKIVSEIRIGHFSNGNIFPENEGVKIPLTFCAGYCF